MTHVATNESFDSDIANGLVLVDFYADWCGPCQVMLKKLPDLEAQLEGKAKVMKVDVDASGEVAGKFGIMSIPTLLLFKDGELVEKLVGSQEVEDLVALVEKHV